MKVAIPSDTSEGPNSRISYLFGRAPFIAIAEVQDQKLVDVRVESNPYAQIPGGAGPSLAQYLRELGVQVVLASDVGPNAASVLSASGISWIPVPAGITVREAIETYLRGSLPQPQALPPPIAPPPYPLSREEEIRWLKERRDWIKKRIEEIEKRLKEIS